MSLTASPIRRYGSSSLKMRSPISAISAGIASRQHSACSDILPSAPISVIFLLLPPLSFYHPLLFQQTHGNLGYKSTTNQPSNKKIRQIREIRGENPISNLQSPYTTIPSRSYSR